MSADVIEISDKQREGFIKEAHKQIVRARHQLILTMARAGKTRDEINGVVSLIEWKLEQDWVAEELEVRAKLPIQIPIPPPNAAPQVEPDAVDPQS